MKKESEAPQPLSIKRNMLWNSMGSLFNMVCQWLITVLVVRFSSGYDSAGVYSLAMSVYGMFSQVAQYRTYTYQISDVHGENSVGEYLSFRALTGGAAVVLTMGYAALTCRPNALLAIFLYAVFKLAGLMIDVLHASDQQCHRMDYIGKSLIMQGIVSLGLFALVFGTTGNLELALLLMAVGVGAVGILYDFPHARALATIRPGITWAKARHLLVRCAPVVIAGIACSAAPSIPRQYLSATMGDSALGIYASVAAPVAVIQMGASYVYNPLLGYLSESYDKGDRHGFLRLMTLTFGGIVAVGVVCSIGLAFLGGPLLSLVYGADIVKYLYLLQPLVFCAIITGVTWFVNDLLIALRNFRCTFIGSMVALGVSLAATVPAQNLLGMNGVTAANVLSCLASSAFMMVCLSWQVRDRFKSSGSGGAADGASEGEKGK